MSCMATTTHTTIVKLSHEVVVSLIRRALRETQALPSVHGFAEGILSGPRQS
jgi:hypothetical protein